MEGGGHAPIQTVRDPIDFVNNADPNVDNVVFTNNNTTGPTQGHQYATDGHLQTDDVGILWLQDQSASNISAVLAQLHTNGRWGWKRARSKPCARSTPIRCRICRF